MLFVCRLIYVLFAILCRFSVFVFCLLLWFLCYVMCVFSVVFVVLFCDCVFDRIRHNNHTNQINHITIVMCVCVFCCGVGLGVVFFFIFLGDFLPFFWIGDSWFWICCFSIFLLIFCLFQTKKKAENQQEN